MARPALVEPQAEPMVNIFIHRKSLMEKVQDTDENGNKFEYLPLSINGVIHKLPIGKALSVPESVAEVLNNYLGSIK